MRIYNILVLYFQYKQLENTLEYLNHFYLIKESMNINTKSNFLEKKKQQRKKTQQQIQVKSKLLTIQKNMKAFLARRKIIHQALQENNVQCILMMGADISKFGLQIIKARSQALKNYPEQKRLNSLTKIILSCMRTQDTSLIQLALQLASSNAQYLDGLFKSKNFAYYLSNLLKTRKGVELLNICWSKLRESPFIELVPSQLLFYTMIESFKLEKIETQGIFKNSIKLQIILSISDLLSKRAYKNSELSENQFYACGSIFLACLKECDKNCIDKNINGFIFLINVIKTTLQKMFDQTIKILSEKNKNLLSLIEDEQQLQYFENKMKSQPQYEQFCEGTLMVAEQVFREQKVLHFIMLKSQKFRQVLASLISQLTFIYDGRKILFVYRFLSDETSLKEMFKQKKMQFYSALNMKLTTMNDQDFVQSKLFNDQQWREIIQSAILRALDIVKKMLVYGIKKDKVIVKNRLFKRGDQDQSELKILSELLNNLNKKCSRTSKIPIQYFINNDLDKSFNTFKFGAGARAIEVMLKNFPFAFRFESRMKKLQESIKADKLNHDRSLFLQEEVDPDLIIQVRRGHEFLDAFNNCYAKDLRKKYKIIFFNEQGLEQEGIDGGGIIKQFINRVLKSSFSSVYGMFYETQQNQILPNQNCPMKAEYEFVGKIVGKAVYQGINIQQKFAEPFLNLLIGRQNSFEDLQYIDKQIYKSMLYIRKMSKQDLQSMQQTFTVLDQSTFGQKKYVNLKHLGNKNYKGPEVIVNNENKMQFVMTYADYKCNKQLEEKTRLFRKGFLTVMKSEWLAMFSNQELNQIISGSNPNYSVIELKNNVVYHDYNEKSQTIIDLWSILSELTAEQKSAFLFFVTSCSRPPTMGFSAMKPLICIQRSTQLTYLPTANTCMNVLRLPDYKNKLLLKEKLLYAINAKAGFEFA